MYNNTNKNQYKMYSRKQHISTITNQGAIGKDTLPEEEDGEDRGTISIFNTFLYSIVSKSKIGITKFLVVKFKVRLYFFRTSTIQCFSFILSQIRLYFNDLRCLYKILCL